MIDIWTSKGELYRFDEETGRVLRNDVVIPSYKVEPIYSDVTNRSNPPVFSGLWLKETNQIVTRAGNIHPVSDINAVY